MPGCGVVIACSAKMCKSLCEYAATFAEAVIAVAPREALEAAQGFCDEAYVVPGFAPHIGAAVSAQVCDSLRGRDIEVVLVESSRDLDLVSAFVSADLGCEVVPNAVSMIEHEAAEGLGLGGAAMRRLRTGGPLLLSFKTAPDFEPIATARSLSSLTELSEPDGDEGRIRYLERIESESTVVDLAGARVVVDLGRGVSRREDFEKAMELARRMGAGVACTLPYHDEFGWLPKSSVVGISGESVAPELYLALGISGQSQHVASIRRAHKIFAVNDDPSAPIFECADWGLVLNVGEFLDLALEVFVKMPPSGEGLQKGSISYDGAS